MAGLLSYIETTKGQPFHYGKSDCVLWVADFIKQETGIDPAEKLRGKYTSQYSCKRVLAFNGGLERVVSEGMAGFPEGEDAVLVEVDGRLAAGIKSGDGVAIKDAVGSVILNNPKIIKGWAIWSKQ